MTRLLAPRFLITILVIIAASVLRALDMIGPTDWITATLGAGGVYSFAGAPADLKEAQK